MNNSLARNKLSCTIDTRRPEGRELLLRLAERSDVFIDNFKAGGLARMGIHAGELQARNPRLVVVGMPATGLTGDWSGYTGFGAQFDGLTGMLWLCGHRDSELMTSPGDDLHGRRLGAGRRLRHRRRPALPRRAPAGANSSSSTRARTSSTTSETSSSTASWASSRGGGGTGTPGGLRRGSTAAAARISGWPSRWATTRPGVPSRR